MTSSWPSAGLRAAFGFVKIIEANSHDQAAATAEGCEEGNDQGREPSVDGA
jgi:hypothetical protein